MHSLLELLVLMGAFVAYLAIGFLFGVLGKREIVKEQSWQDVSFWRRCYWTTLFPTTATIVLL